MNALDIYDEIPSDMRIYLSHNGWHFNRKAYEYAVPFMKGNNVRMFDKKSLDEMLERYGVRVERKGGYDYLYVASMCMADFWGSSIEDEMHLCRFIKDTCDDIDASDGVTMRRWYATMVANGIGVEWSEIL